MVPIRSLSDHDITTTILYNRMIVVGIYHRYFNYISIDKLTTHESFASVSNFSVIYIEFIVRIIVLTKTIAIQGLFIVKAIILFIDDTYL